MATDRSALTSIDREKASVFHSWSAQGSINPLMVKSAAGVYVTMEDDTTFLDFSSQLVNTNIGHQHPAVVRAIQEQAATLTTIAPQHGYSQRYRAAEMILDHSFDGAAKVFFTNGGTEAVEHAVRMARLHTGRTKVLAAYRSYHGATATSINLTGDPRRWPNDSGGAGVVHFFGPFLYRSAYFATTEEEECQRSLLSLENTINFEGPSTIAAIILETIPGTAGIMVPPKGYLKGVRELCDRFGIVYIAAWRRRHQRSDQCVVQRTDLPRRSHLFWSPLGLRGGGGDDGSDGERGNHRERATRRRRGLATRARGVGGNAPHHW